MQINEQEFIKMLLLFAVRSRNGVMPLAWDVSSNGDDSEIRIKFQWKDTMATPREETKVQVLFGTLRLL